MENIRELRQFLANTIKDLQSKKIDASEANTYAHLAGKIITSLGVEILYNRMRDNDVAIPFLEQDLKKKLKGITWE